MLRANVTSENIKTLTENFLQKNIKDIGKITKFLEKHQAYSRDHIKISNIQNNYKIIFEKSTLSEQLPLDRIFSFIFKNKEHVQEILENSKLSVEEFRKLIVSNEDKLTDALTTKLTGWLKEIQKEQLLLKKLLSSNFETKEALNQIFENSGVSRKNFAYLVQNNVEKFAPEKLPEILLWTKQLSLEETNKKDRSELEQHWWAFEGEMLVKASGATSLDISENCTVDQFLDKFKEKCQSIERSPIYKTICLEKPMSQEELIVKQMEILKGLLFREIGHHEVSQKSDLVSEML